MRPPSVCVHLRSVDDFDALPPDQQAGNFTELRERFLDCGKVRACGWGVPPVHPELRLPLKLKGTQPVRTVRCGSGCILQCKLVVPLV